MAVLLGTGPAWAQVLGGLRTNWKKALVAAEEIRPGGPPPDGIPAIDKPKFLSVAEADKWLKDREPVIAFEAGGDARAYPLQIMTWHEIVNDTVGGRPVAVTFCPLCNSALAFDRRVGGEVLDFGTSGMLHKSDLVMYDRATHSLWAQMLGKALAGDLAGTQLQMIPAGVVAWGDWKQAHPNGRVLSRDTGHARPYGRNPYVGYDDIGQSPFLFSGPLDKRLPPMERVVALALDGAEKAYPLSVLARQPVIHDRVGPRDVVIFHRPGMASALDGPSIPDSREVGATGAFAPLVDGKRLTFELRDGAIVDRETGTRWDILGRGLAGQLAGKALPRVLHLDTFWFAWAAFRPNTTIFGR
jgi:hypothetical protein